MDFSPLLTMTLTGTFLGFFSLWTAPHSSHFMSASCASLRMVWETVASGEHEGHSVSIYSISQNKGSVYKYLLLAYRKIIEFPFIFFSYYLNIINNRIT